jgi:hypothetical protein
MPMGPRGERRPADVIGAAVMVAKIATGEITEAPKRKSGRVRSGHAGAKARAIAMSAERRREIAGKAARRRWGHGGTNNPLTASNGGIVSATVGTGSPIRPAAWSKPPARYLVIGAAALTAMLARRHSEKNRRDD